MLQFKLPGLQDAGAPYAIVPKGLGAWHKLRTSIGWTSLRRIRRVLRTLAVRVVLYPTKTKALYFRYFRHDSRPREHMERTSKGRPVRQGQPGGNGYLHIHSFTAIPNRVLTPPVRHEGNCRQEELKYRRLRFRSEVARVSIRFTDQ
ncbi:hypothetical protein IEO21_01555 [Rhodonia placenta]|uniref:Uncharacterized protein n=1 Tax=Rhodonia placenta TaxID=104341 RepID=A0A8H7P9B9_9APHY|nr:hypothetical protein IEO21_01555 [Postia placenta]